MLDSIPGTQGERWDIPQTSLQFSSRTIAKLEPSINLTSMHSDWEETQRRPTQVVAPHQKDPTKQELQTQKLKTAPPCCPTAFEMIQEDVKQAFHLWKRTH